MSISRPNGVVALVAAAAAWVGIHCAVSGDCLRTTDCDTGLVCGAGHCVVPVPVDAGALDDAVSSTPADDAGDDGSSAVTDPGAGDDAGGDDAGGATGDDSGGGSASADSGDGA